MDFIGFTRPGSVNIAIENGTFIVDFPIENVGSFHTWNPGFVIKS